MEKLIDIFFTNPVLQWLAISTIIIILIIILILFVQYNIDRAKGRHAKFLWFEVNAMKPPHSAPEDSKASSTTIHGKNVNTGTNFGEIGDNIPVLSSEM